MELTTADRLEIAELCARACHYLDFDEPDRYAGLFTADGWFRRQAALRAGGEVIFTHTGTDALRTFAESVTVRRAGLARHWTTNLIVDVIDGRVTATSYTMMVATGADDHSVGITVAGTYHDVLVKAPDGWRFAGRTVLDDA